MNHFTGLIHLLNKNGTMAFAKKLSKGIKTTPSFYSKALQDANPYKQKMIEDCQTVIINHYKDWYRIWGDSDDLHIDYVRTEYLGFTTETVCGYSFLPDDPIDTGSGGSAAGEESGEGTYKSDCTPTTNSNYVAKITDPCAKKVEVELMQVVNQLDNPCAHAIFENLLAGIYKTNPLKPEVKVLEDDINLSFSKSILKLFENSNRYLTIRDDDLTGVNAHTNNTLITMDNTYLNKATQLSIARSIIHETVHAFLNAQYNYVSDFNSYTFSEKMDKYATDHGFHPNGTPEQRNTFQHNFMGQFVNAMAYSLYKWDKDYGTGGNLGWNYYKAMAFGGLFHTDPNGKLTTSTDTFKELVLEEDRQSIADIVFNELDKNNENAKGTKCSN